MRTHRRKHSGPPPQRTAGFTLVEILGALVLLSLMVAAATPPLIQLIRESRRRTESRMMDRISEAFERAVTLNKCIPSTNPASWTPLVAAELSLPEDVVSTNGAGTARLVIFDPALNVGGVTTASLPYRQQASGAAGVANARVVLLSALQDSYPDVDFHSASGFSNLWQRAEHTLPGNWPAGWASEAGDLVLRRLDLGALFHEVVLNNLDPRSAAPFATLTNSLSGLGQTNSLASTNVPFTARFIHGTPLRLNLPDGRPQAVIMVTEPISFAFESGRWSRRVHTGVTGPATCGPLGSLVESFINHPGWGTTTQGTSAESVILGMFDMLCGCRDWADAGFENENGNSKWEAPTARFVFDVAPQLMLSSQDLIGQ